MGYGALCLGVTRLVPARIGSQGTVRRAQVCCDVLWFDMAVKARTGLVGNDLVRYGKTWQIWSVPVRMGMHRRGSVDKAR